MAGVSTGVSLLPAGQDQSLVAWFDMDSGSTYQNKVKLSQTITTVSGLQTTTNPVSVNLGSYHSETFSPTIGSSSRPLNWSTDPIQVENTFTVGFWVKNTAVVSFTGTNRASVFEIDADLRASLNASGSLSFFANGSYRISTSTVIGTSWRFIVFIFRNVGGSNYVVDLYDNNSLVGTSSTFSYSSANGNFYNFSSKNFGESNVPGSPNMSVDSLFIFNKQLSDSEINFLYNSGNGRKYEDL